MDAKRIKLYGAENSNGGLNFPIRTLCVSPVNVDMGDQIKCYFERFGTVTSVEIEHTDNADTHFALVEFKMAGAAAAVLSSIRMHRIDGCRVQVKAADPWFQPDHILNALNDDCLRLIFKKLNQKDLTNAANVCVRFNEEAKWVFSTKSKKLIFTQWNTQDEIENTLKTFGPTVQSIDIKSDHSVQRTHAMKMMIAQYCTSALKELTICGFDFEDQLPENTDVTFDLALSKLERLTFIDCELRDSLKELVSACVDLIVLHIESCRQDCAWSNWPEFNELEELRLVNNRGLYGFFKNDIITTNSKLTKVSLIGPGSWKLNQTIVQNNLNLVELEFIRNYIPDAGLLEIFRCCSRLTSLKVVKLDLNRGSATPLCAILTDIASIEHLKLINGFIDTDSIDAISEMKQLKVLELSDIDGLTDEHLIVLAKGLGSQLEKLELKGSTAVNLTTIGLKKMLPFATKLSLLTLKSKTITIDVDDYKAMLATVQKRPKNASLSIEFSGKGEQVDVNKKELEKNRNSLYIDVKIENSSFDVINEILQRHRRLLDDFMFSNNLNK